MRTLLVGLVGLLLLACGGGGGGSDAPLETLTLLPIPALTGHGWFPFEVESDTSLRIGDTDADVAFRGYCGIDLGALPEGARIVTAHLLLHASGSNGHPWDLGDLVLDHLVLGTILDPDDYTAPALEAACHTVPPIPVGEDARVDVTAQVLRDLGAGRATTGFRFRLVNATDDDGSYDYIVLSGSNSFTGPKPVVEVAYRR